LVPGEVDVEYMRDAACLIVELSHKNEVAVVCGGGRLARKYIKAARQFNASEAYCDVLGIEASRLNARLLSCAIGEKATTSPPNDFNEALEALQRDKIVVMGGTHPGHSTDGVSALLAEYVKADYLINATDVDGIYDADPKKKKDARLFKEITPRKLMDIVLNKSVGAGEYALVDPLAVKIIERSAIKTIFLSGKNLPNIKKAVSGGEYKGTLVKK